MLSHVGVCVFQPRVAILLSASLSQEELKGKGPVSSGTLNQESLLECNK